MQCRFALATPYFQGEPIPWGKANPQCLDSLVKGENGSEAVFLAAGLLAFSIPASKCSWGLGCYCIPACVGGNSKTPQALALRLEISRAMPEPITTRVNSPSSPE